MFRLYNFVSLADQANCNLGEPSVQTLKLKEAVTQMSLRSLTTVIQECKRDESDASDILSEADENEIISDVALMEELKHAGCTIEPEVDGFRTLLPVCVFFL